MIYSFYVENFLSIRDRQEISFATTSDKTVRDFVAVEVKPNVYINKLGIFYGANASGKTNIIKALDVSPTSVSTAVASAGRSTLMMRLLINMSLSVEATVMT